MEIGKTLEIVTASAETNLPASSMGEKGRDGEEEQKEEAVAEVVKSTGDLPSPTASSASATDLQKKLRRAERFGVPVLLSEEEKRNSRAERFGTAPSSQGSSEEQKRKTRAERFGTAKAEISTTDEEAKKKARLARFAGDNSKPIVNSVEEEEKRKARAIRFSQTTSNASSHLNGKQNPGTVDKANKGT